MVADMKPTYENVNSGQLASGKCRTEPPDRPPMRSAVDLEDVMRR